VGRQALCFGDLTSKIYVGYTVKLRVSVTSRVPFRTEMDRRGMDGDTWRWVEEDDVLQQNPNPVLWLSFSSETLISGSCRSTPLVFSMRGLTNIFVFFVF
jgi:hypothetical protein